MSDKPTPEQLCREYKAGNQAAAEALLARCMPMINGMVRKYRRSAYEDDLLSEAYYGFAGALRNYKTDSKVPFIIYLKLWMKTYLVHHVRSTRSAVKHPNEYNDQIPSDVGFDAPIRSDLALHDVMADENVDLQRGLERADIARHVRYAISCIKDPADSDLANRLLDLPKAGTGAAGRVRLDDLAAKYGVSRQRMSVKDQNVRTRLKRIIQHTMRDYVA